MTRMQAVRTRRQWTQTYLAELAGVAQSDISAIERGWRKPYPRQAKRLAMVLGVKASELTQDVPELTHGGV